MDSVFLIIKALMKKIIILQLLVMLFVPTIRAAPTASVDKKHNWTEVSPDKKTEIAANMRQAKHFMEKGKGTSGFYCSVSQERVC